MREICSFAKLQETESSVHTNFEKGQKRKWRRSSSVCGYPGGLRREMDICVLVERVLFCTSVAVCCSASGGLGKPPDFVDDLCCSVLQCVVVCCGAFHCVTMCQSVPGG